MMNILFVVPYVPNLIRTRPYNFIRYLTNLGHSVTVVAPWADDAERHDVEKLHKYCDQVVTAHLSRSRSIYNCIKVVPTQLPLQAVYCWQPALAELLTDIVNTSSDGQAFDVIHVEHLRGAQYGTFLDRHLDERKLKIPIIWDSVDNISYLFSQSSTHSKKPINRLITRFELGRTQKYESWLVEQFDRVLVTSKADRDAFWDLSQQDSQDLDIEILPNGVDLEYFTPGEVSNRELDTLVVTGKMSYHANISMVFELVDKILPSVWDVRPDLKLWIVGKDPTRDITSLASHPNIIVTGTVEDIRPYLQRATIAVAPITYGAGIQNKILEAMACSTPVVAYPSGISALNVKSNVDLLVGDGPSHFADQILALLADSQLRTQIGWNGRQYVLKNHSWEAIVARLTMVYEAAIKNMVV